jgi:hypothetical protein
MNTLLLRFLTTSGLGLILIILSGTLPADPQPQEPVSDGWLTAVVGPGGGASCSYSPCSVYYRIPDLGGPVEVIANNFSEGTFPSGKTVSLGNFNDSVRITIRGKDVPTAYVNVPGERFR